MNSLTPFSLRYYIIIIIIIIIIINHLRAGYL